MNALTRAGLHAGCILLCALLAGTGPADAVLDEAASVDDIERLEQAVFGPDEAAPESEMRRRVAWALLATGRDRAALRQFARLAGREPDAGDPKIGYSLSAAKLGDLTNAARAIRRVLRVEPEALDAVPIDESLYAQLEGLRTRYMKRLARFDHDRDGAVMLAAVSYMLGEPDTARYAIGYLTANGERGRSTENLDRLVRDLANPPVSEQLAEVIEAAPEAPAEAPAPEPVDEPAEAPEAVAADDDALDFTLVFDKSAAQVPARAATAPVPVPVTATVVDPWAPASADTLDVTPPVAAIPPAPKPAPKPEPQPEPVQIHEVPERYQVDYDKLKTDLGSVGGALDTFTQKLIRNIAALQAKDQPGGTVE